VAVGMTDGRGRAGASPLPSKKGAASRHLRPRPVISGGSLHGPLRRGGPLQGTSPALKVRWPARPPREEKRPASGPATSRTATGHSLKHSLLVDDDAAFCWRPAQTREPHAAPSSNNSASSPGDSGSLGHPTPTETGQSDGKRPGIRLPPLGSTGSCRLPTSRLPPLGSAGSRRLPTYRMPRDASIDDSPPGHQVCGPSGRTQVYSEWRPRFVFPHWRLW